MIGGSFSLTYDNMTSSLTTEAGQPVTEVKVKKYPSLDVAVSAETPGRKTGKVRTLKIQMGLSCNFSCTYCLQRFVPRAPAMSVQDAEAFLAQLPGWFAGGDDGKGAGVCIQFWGGEPLVYWSALRLLGERLREMYPRARFHTITNGSLLTAEIVEWLDRMDFGVCISHDGPGQATRGADPMADPRQKAVILDLYRRLKPKRKISVNAMLHKDNQSRAAIASWLKAAFEDEGLPIGEGSFVDAYDDGGLASSLSDAEAAPFRKAAFDEVRSGAAKNFLIVESKIRDFIISVTTARPAGSLGQKCGMDRPESIAVDLKGRVLTCQNVSAVAPAPNGQSHLLGTVDDLDKVELRSATHWSKRLGCAECPVLQLCQGSCMYVEGAHWEASCANSYSNAIPFFAAGVEVLTGLIVDRIEPLGGALSPERQWLWVARGR
jgi:uncharacterized protein